MSIQRLCFIVLMFLALGACFFAKEIFNFAIRSSGSKMFIERWPTWMIPVYIWMVRIIGIVIAIISFILFMKNR